MKLNFTNHNFAHCINLPIPRGPIVTEDDTVLEMTSDEVQKSKTPPRLKRRRFAPIKIANQIPEA